MQQSSRKSHGGFRGRRIRAADAAEAGGDAAGQGKKARSEASAALVIRYGRYTHLCRLISPLVIMVRCKLCCYSVLLLGISQRQH